MEPEIAPLARRLAEENNVNWRALTGSGANGRILERDVLEYLARVMAGEEDMNPTAEPLPEGMDAWPEDDVRSFYGEAAPVANSASEAATDIGFAPDLADEALFVDTPEPVLSASMPEEAFEDDVFLVDEESTQDLSVGTLHSSSEAVTYDTSFDADDEDVSDIYGALTMDEEPVEVLEVAAFEDSAVEEFAEESLGGLEDEFVEEPQTSPVFLGEDDVIEEVPVEEAFAAIVEESPMEEEFATDAFTPVEDLTPTEDVFAASAEVTEDVSSDFTEALPSHQPLDVPQGVSSDFAEEPRAADTWQESEVLPELVAPEEPISQPTPDYVAPAFVAPVAAVATGAVLGVAARGLGQDLKTQTPTPIVSGSLPLVSYGILLRRHVDLGTLIQAQHAVTEELGREEPVAVTSFLLRAAAKALHKVPLVQGPVGLAIIREQGVGITAIPEAASAPFRSVLAQSQQIVSGPLGQDQIALAVADMSAFDIDEAVLNIGVPVLTLGRTMYDNSRGTHHSTLSISGNVSVESGTKFLSAVAELLNSPVRLVV